MEKTIGPQDYIVYSIRSSFREFSQTNNISYVAKEEIKIEDLDVSRRGFAKDLAREIRQSGNQTLNFEAVQVQDPGTGSWLNFLSATVDTNQPVTLLEEGIYSAFEDQHPVGSTSVRSSTGEIVKIPIYKAKFLIRNTEVATEVAFAKMQQPCILGNNTFSLLSHDNPKWYYDLKDNYINRAYRATISSKKNTILILGSFRKDQRSRLEEARKIVFDLGYRPLMLDDFEDIQEQTLAEKLMFFGAMSHMVICIDIESAGHYVELALCESLKFITAILHETPDEFGTIGTSTAMLAHLVTENNCINSFTIEESALDKTIEDALIWGNQFREDKMNRLNELYQCWRKRTPAVLKSE
ncbi:hypothetical protein [Microbulbifer magnicolonia]|uniref:hypothetical protein n=1 Tax=Microbulbifer magnicolonia TaxID=3109744 RepID=UPI002B40BB03|nr:hypothetical protein [Microbulbifer sp. GG15]